MMTTINTVMFNLLLALSEALAPDSAGGGAGFVASDPPVPLSATDLLFILIGLLVIILLIVVVIDSFH